MPAQPLREAKKPVSDKRTSQELASNGRGMHLDTFAPFSVSVPPLIEKISYNAT